MEDISKLELAAHLIMVILHIIFILLIGIYFRLHQAKSVSKTEKMLNRFL